MRCLFLAVLILAPATGLAQPSADSLLARQLALRVEADQAARELWNLALQRGQQPTPADFDLVSAIDSLNTAWLKGIVAERGWPKAREVGEQGAHNAWLLVQHADRDPAFQREVLALMEVAVSEGEASGSDFAYLIDRVRLAAGEPQVYGTQLSVVDGEPVPLELEDSEGVDERRASVGLMPLEEYLDFVRQQLGRASVNDEGSPVP